MKLKLNQMRAKNWLLGSKMTKKHGLSFDLTVASKLGDQKEIINNSFVSTSFYSLSSRDLSCKNLEDHLLSETLRS